MRLFVALDLSEPVRAAIASFCEKLRRVLPSARWVRPEGIHVTLKFIGEVNEDRVAPIQTALGKIHSAAPVEMTFRGTGFFPNERRPRIFWAGIDASPNLAQLAAEIESQLEPLGIPRESREFRPHLTLARFDGLHGIEKLHAALKESAAHEFGAVKTSEMHLYQSKLGRGGAQYTRLATFHFSPEAM
ncbi:MAG TPA: RNA 2',3'-cyclic phosphodiesterase [Candidatus Acidoferrales bacterium]|nr:RNA 2',3'-cyclic phosphodiesterase [Candidatus Acidoferrales bacterium]